MNHPGADEGREQEGTCRECEQTPQVDGIIHDECPRCRRPMCVRARRASDRPVEQDDGEAICGGCDEEQYHPRRRGERDSECLTDAERNRSMR